MIDKNGLCFTFIDWLNIYIYIYIYGGADKCLKKS